MLSKRDQDILQAVNYYRFMTALDVAHLLFSPGSRTWVRSILSRLSGNADLVSNHYLYRIALPKSSAGNSERIFTLGTKGRDVLIEMGIDVDWHIRPDRIKHYTYGQLLHNIFLTRFVVAAKYWAKQRTEISVPSLRLSYEIGRNPLMREARGVIPDAWLLFQGKHRYPVLVEIDRGTEYQKAFKEHVAARIEFVRNGIYQQLFGERAVMIVYITTGDTQEYRQARVRSMVQWTGELLSEQQRENWAGIFRFGSAAFDELYQVPLFAGEVWQRPDADKPVSMFSL